MKKTTLLILILIIFILIVGCNKNSQYVDAGIDNINNQDNKNVDTSNQPNYEVVEKTNNNANNVAEEDGFESVTGMAVIDSVETNEEAYLDDGINVIDNKPILDPRIQKLVDNARKVIKYSYKARYPESYGRRHVIVLISDNKIRITYPQQEFIVMRDSYDNIYLDTKTKEAIAYCEDKIRCNDPNSGFEVDYENYLPKTPIDWTKELIDADNIKVIGNEYNHDRSLLVVEYELNGILYRQSLTDRYGASKIYINYGPKVEIIDIEFTGEGFGEDEIVHQYVY